MLYLLRLEWLKLKDYTPFRVIGILYLALLPLLLMTGKAILPDTDGPGVGDAPFSTASVYQFPDIWSWMAYEGNWLVFFLFGFLAVLMVTNEFGNKTLRQNIITGIGRTEFFWSKVFFVLLVALGATLWYFLCATVLGLVYTDTFYWSVYTKKLDLVPRYFLMCVGYMSIGLLIGTVVRRTGIALFLYLCYGMFIEQILRYMIHGQIAMHRSLHFYPVNLLEDLTPLPFAEMAQGFQAENGFGFFLEPWEATLGALGFTALFFYFVYRKLRYSDL